MNAAVDPGLLAAFVATGRAVRAPFAAATGTVAAHLATAGDGPVGATRAALADLDHLLAELAADEDDVDALRRRIVGADRDGACAPAPPPPPAPFTVAWTDDHTDSWVVNLTRAMTGRGLTPEFTRRLVDDGPAHAEALARAIDELSPLGSQRRLVTDRAGWIADWRRAGGRGAEATLEQTSAAVGVAVATLPGGDDLVERLTGRRPGDELRASVLDLARGAVTDPDAVADGILGLSRLQDDPHLWVGDNAPDLLLQMSGVLAAARPARVLAGGGRALDGADATPHLPDLRVQRLAEPEWGPAPAVASRRAGPFEPPEGWVADINGEGMAAPGRSTNCIDCARAVEANWRGDDAVAAPLADARITGTPSIAWKTGRGPSSDRRPSTASRPVCSRWGRARRPSWPRRGSGAGPMPTMPSTTGGW